jgi:hypothetical protein
VVTKRATREPLSGKQVTTDRKEKFMDAASILVLILTLGGVALLIWFEINSRRNDARAKRSIPVQANPETLQKEKPTSDSGKQKAA